MVNSPWKKRCALIGSAENQLLPHNFERHQWQKTIKISIIYLIYKWCICLFLITVLLCSIFHGTRYKKTDNNYWKWFLYLTNWGYMLCTIQAILSLWIIQAAYIKKSNTEDGRTYIPKHYKAYWIFHSAATSVAFTITFMYWLTVHNPNKHVLDAVNILVHAGNSILMVFDLCVIGHPCPLFHVIYGMTTGLLYSFFSFIYYECGGTDRDGNPFLYEGLDWRKPGKAIIFSAISIAVVTVAHCIAWTISKIRQCIANRRKKDISLPEFAQPLQEKPNIIHIN